MCSEISLENFNVPCLPPVHAQRLKNLSGMFDFNFRLADELYICLSRTARIIIPEIVFWSSGLFFFPKSQALAVEVACVLGATRLLGDGVLPHSRTKRKPQHHLSPTLAWRDVRLTNSPIPTRHTGTRIHCIPTHLHTYIPMCTRTYIRHMNYGLTNLTLTFELSMMTTKFSQNEKNGTLWNTWTSVLDREHSLVHWTPGREPTDRHSFFEYSRFSHGPIFAIRLIQIDTHRYKYLQRG